MAYLYPFGEEVHKVVQQDRSPKKVFVLGKYASAVHARWLKDGKEIVKALAVASEPRIFWDGNEKEAAEIISRIHIPEELGYLEPAVYNGPSAKELDEQILEPLGFTRSDAWLCDLLPETRLNENQIKAIKRAYEPLQERYGLNPVTIPEVPDPICDQKRCEEIIAELEESQAKLLILLGEDALKMFFNSVANVQYSSLEKYVEKNGYGVKTEAIINGKKIEVIPFTHPRQTGGLGTHSSKWTQRHSDWVKQIKK
jgi:uracil-DNA glycosylase